MPADTNNDQVEEYSCTAEGVSAHGIGGANRAFPSLESMLETPLDVDWVSRDHLENYHLGPSE